MNQSFKITCQACHQRFEGFAPSQAVGCAAALTGSTITGLYGSLLAENEQYVFNPGKRPAHLEDGNICDPCLRQWFESGVIDRYDPKLES